MNKAKPPADNPGIVVPPPLIFASLLACGWAADTYWTGLAIPLPTLPQQISSWLLLAGAAGLLGDALFGFLRARTSPEPWKTTTTIVVRGSYRFTRNPMYLGMALGHAGLALLADSPVALLAVVPATWIIDRMVIRREEAYLQGKFGDEYANYRARVRRWL